MLSESPFYYFERRRCPAATPIFMIGGETMKKSVPIFTVVTTITLIAGAIIAWDQAQARARRKRRVRRRTSN